MIARHIITPRVCNLYNRQKIAWAAPLLECIVNPPHGMAEMNDDPPSPCTGVCRIDDSAGWCSGCHRTLDEIAAWPGAPAAFKRSVLARLDKRTCAVSPGGE